MPPITPTARKRKPRTNPDPRSRAAARANIAAWAAEGKLGVADGMRLMRLSLAMDQERFATAFRMTRRQVSEIERGVGNPTIETLERVSKAFGLRIGFVPQEKTALPSADDQEPDSNHNAQ